MVVNIPVGSFACLKGFHFAKIILQVFPWKIEEFPQALSGCERSQNIALFVPDLDKWVSSPNILAKELTSRHYLKFCDIMNFIFLGAWYIERYIVNRSVMRFNSNLFAYDMCTIIFVLEFYKSKGS